MAITRQAGITSGGAHQLARGLSINMSLTWAELGALMPSRLFGTGRTEEFIGRLVLTRFFVRMYRPEDVSAEGAITGRPYYGVVTTRAARDFFGAVTALPVLRTDIVDIAPLSNYKGDGGLPSSVRVGTGVTSTFTNTLPSTGNAWFLQFHTGRSRSLRFPIGTNIGGTEAYARDKIWSANPCTGTWVAVYDANFTYQTRTNTGLINNHSISVTQRGNIVVLEAENFPCPGDPPPSRVVTSSMVTSSTALISWNAQSGILQPSYWQWSTDEETWTRVPGDGSATSVTITGLTPNTQYTIYIRGVAVRGNSRSGSTTFRTLAGGPLPTTVPAPTVSSSNVGEVSATINWVAGTGGLAVAKWQWSTDNSTWTDVPGGAVPTSLAVENLTPGTVYTYYIRGVVVGWGE